MKNLIIVILAVLLAAFYFNSKEVQKPSPTANTAKIEANTQTPMVQPTATPFVANVPTVTVNDLASLHGRITSITPNGIIFRCEEPIHTGAWSNVSLPATASAGDIKNAAGAGEAYDQILEKKTYGELLEVNNGKLLKAWNKPTNQASGILFVAGLPVSEIIKPGQQLRLIAAPTGQTFNNLPVYTALYNYQGQPPRY